MKLALDILGMVVSFITIRQENHVLLDPTVYQVKTGHHEYAGKILFQDGMIIKLKVSNEKVVKILKENIEKITIQKEGTIDFN